MVDREHARYRLRMLNWPTSPDHHQARSRHAAMPSDVIISVSSIAILVQRQVDAIAWR
jgi:hypothetical protein